MWLDLVRVQLGAKSEKRAVVVPAPFNSLSRPECACISIRKPNEALGEWNEAVCLSASGHVAAQRDSAAAPGSKTERDASATRECVSHLQGRRKWPPLPRYLTYFCWLWRRSGAQSEAQEVQLYKRTEAENKYTTNFGLLFVIRVQNYLECARLTFCSACDFVVYPLFCNL